MRCKRKIFIVSKRTQVRKFIDLLNELEIFKEKIEYPVYHPGCYESNTDLKLIDGIDEYLVAKEYSKYESGKTYIDKYEFRTKNIEQIKKLYSTHHKGYFDFNYTLHFKDDLNKICTSTSMKKNKDNLRDYLLEKFESLDNLKVYKDEFEIRDDDRYLFNFKITIDNHPKYEYRYYFGIDLIISKDKEKHNTCEFTFNISTINFKVFI